MEEIRGGKEGKKGEVRKIRWSRENKVRVGKVRGNEGKGVFQGGESIRGKIGKVGECMVGKVGEIRCGDSGGVRRN